MDERSTRHLDEADLADFDGPPRQQERELMRQAAALSDRDPVVGRALARRIAFAGGWMTAWRFRILSLVLIGGIPGPEAPDDVLLTLAMMQVWGWTDVTDDGLILITDAGRLAIQAVMMRAGLLRFRPAN